jgi:hypothetical protein
MENDRSLQLHDRGANCCELSIIVTCRSKPVVHSYLPSGMIKPSSGEGLIGISLNYSTCTSVV